MSYFLSIWGLSCLVAIMVLNSKAKKLHYDLGRLSAFMDSVNHCHDRARVAVELSAKGEMSMGLIRAQMALDISEEIRNLALEIQ